MGESAALVPSCADGLRQQGGPFGPIFLFFKNGRGGGIRAPDPLLPKQAANRRDVPPLKSGAEHRAVLCGINAVVVRCRLWCCADCENTFLEPTLLNGTRLLPESSSTWVLTTNGLL